MYKRQAQIREGLASKQFTACEVAQASLDRIAQADSQVHAFLEVTSEAAMAAAQRVDQAIADGTFDTLGPLAGVPVAFKDNMNMTGTHTTCSSRMLENYVSPYTATCVQRIIDAGGVPLGKLNMDEFCLLYTSGGALAGLHQALTLGHGAREHERGGALFGGQVGVARAFRQTVLLAHDGAAHNLHVHVQVAHHATDDGQLLGVLLAEVGAVGLGDVHQPVNNLSLIHI